ncbi:aspartate-alanine antiporter [unidentified bacterial endosymbiont]|uniref:aspartate-alanine antiporter n=1 Tax=unidentified bacterial endosymbiont TaxID=2355 RepID=UPI0020A0E10E|nr:aspartate-alanine antiporter [unidentified bacterial endosymbiont]
MSWFTITLRHYPEIAIFLSLGIGYWIGEKRWNGFSLGAVTGTLLAALMVGLFGITISPHVKSIFFLIFLFAVGYGIGPQFIRGVAKDGIPQALFSVVQNLFSLGAAVIAAKCAGYSVGSAVGLFAGSQTISAAMGLATDAINRLLLPATETQQLLDAMPTAYAVSYIFGTIGSALILAKFGPKLLRIDLVAACKDYEEKLDNPAAPQEGLAGWHQYELRAYQIAVNSPMVGMTVGQIETMVQEKGYRLFIEHIRRGDQLQDAQLDTLLKGDDVVAVAGFRDQLVTISGAQWVEVDDQQLLSAVATEGVDVYVSQQAVDGKTLQQLATLPESRGVYVMKIKRGSTETLIPILPSTELHRGDVMTLIGRQQDIVTAAKKLGELDRSTQATDVAFIGLAITLGALIGAVVINMGGVPVTLSTAGGALISGIIFGWLRAIHPTFGRIPEPTIWFMNSVGLNVFIAVVGITAAPGFVAGLQQLGISLFLWGIFTTALPLILGMLTAKYIFKFHPAIILGVCAGSRTTTAALGMICDAAKSQVPGLGFTVTYAVGNILLTIWGMVIVMLMI